MKFITILIGLLTEKDTWFFIVKCFILSSSTFAFVMFWLYQLSRQGKPEERHFVTEVPLKKGIVVKRGGKIRRVFTGGKINYDKNFMIIGKDGEPLKLKNDSVIDPNNVNGSIINPDNFIKNNNHKIFGINWIGIPFVDRIEMFDFTWNDLSQEDKEGKVSTTRQLVPKKETTSMFSTIKTYGFLADSLEVGNSRKEEKPGEEEIRIDDDIREISAKIELDMTFALTILIVDVDKAICGLNWYKGVQGIIKQACLAYCGDHNLEEIINSSGTEVIKKIMASNQEIMDKFGVVIYKISYEGYDYSGTNKETIRTEVTKVWVARQAKLASQEETDAKRYSIEETAKARSLEIELLGKAEAQTIRLVCEAWQGNDNLAMAHAIEKGQVTTLVMPGHQTGVNLNVNKDEGGKK
ncbi:MAG: hypothetical protein PHN69_00740 [Candidatus Pacebacteria bacterium]|nr:hypothetical protein [Candidatus Paceibacterota bacterium]